MLPALMPEVKIVPRILQDASMTIHSLCQDAGIECRVTGPAAERKVCLQPGGLGAVREPGPHGAVLINLPRSGKRDRAILALGILAYAVFDYAARESMRGRPESRMALPPGRPRKAHPLSGAERQRRWRSNHRKDMGVDNT
jgi:hypothetical protein